MGRTVPTGLQPQLDLPSCETQTTLDLYLTDTSEIHVATKALASVVIDTGTVDYTADLRKVNELKQSILTPPDRGTCIIQNVDKVFGGIVASESLIKAVAVVGRYYYDPAGIESPKWVELFRGEAFPLSVIESEVQLEVLGDMVAGGYCVAKWTLAEPCQYTFKNSTTCGYSGSETTCNKKRKSHGGCLGRANMHRFGGMEYPDIQFPTASGGVDFPGNGHPYCPRLDQFVLVRGPYGGTIAKLVRALTLDDLLFNPITGTFHEIKSLTIIPNEPIWRMAAEGGAVCYSSFTHRVLWYRQHATGEMAANFVQGDPMLTWSDRLIDDVTADARYCGRQESVLSIEMADGHIYCAGNEPAKMIVAHNSKLPALEL